MEKNIDQHGNIKCFNEECGSFETFILSKLPVKNNGFVTIRCNRCENEFEIEMTRELLKVRNEILGKIEKKFGG